MFTIVETSATQHGYYQLGYQALTETYYKRVSYIKRGKLLWTDWFRSNCFAE